MGDEQFIRGNIPMTKSEIRAVSLSKLALREEDIFYDVGAGTGSVSVEAAFAVRRGHVYAVEQKEEGCRLIAQNREKFHVGNLSIRQGKAPEALEALPPPDRVFIGGSDGRLEEILDCVWNRNSRARVVLNVIALETLAKISEYVNQKGIEAEIVCIQVAKAERIGRYHMMKGQNPVYIVTLQGKTDESGERL